MPAAAFLKITYIDVVTLRRLADAQARGESTPPAFVDSILRLSKMGYIRGDGSRTIVVTEQGMHFLTEHGASNELLPVS